jgi:hypothetical protein
MVVTKIGYIFQKKLNNNKNFPPLECLIMALIQTLSQTFDA